MALCEVADIHDLPWRTAWWTAWALAAALGVAVAVALRRRQPRAATICAAWIFLSFPAWRFFLGALPDMLRTVCTSGDVAAAIPGPPPLPPGAWEFSGQYIWTLVGTLGYLVVGGILWVHARDPAWWRQPRMSAMAAGIAGLLPMGLGEGPSLRRGIALFPILAAGSLLLLSITGNPILTASRDPFYQNMDVWHAVAIALAAAVTEEVLYRGVMQQGLLHLLGARRRPSWLAQAAAIGTVSLVFAYSHADYGNARLLLFAFLFSVLAGVVAQRWGIWCAIALHALIDFYAFLLDIVHPDASVVWAAGLVAVGVVAVAFVEGRRLVTHLRQPDRG